MYIRHRFWENLVESSECSTEVGAFNLGSFRVNDLAEGVLLQEELLKDLITVLLIDVATSAHGIGPEDA